MAKASRYAIGVVAGLAWVYLCVLIAYGLEKGWEWAWRRSEVDVSGTAGAWKMSDCDGKWVHQVMRYNEGTAGFDVFVNGEWCDPESGHIYEAFHIDRKMTEKEIRQAFLCGIQRRPEGDTGYIERAAAYDIDLDSEEWRDLCVSASDQ